MNTKNFSGIFTALLTPFDKNDKINEKELEKLIKFNVQKGASGFYVGGSTAETFLLSTEERKEIMDIVKATAPDKTLIAHIGSIDERVATELGIYAKKLGYDAVSSVAPFYYKFSFDQIKKHYFDIVEAVDMPMIVYNFPNFSGVNLTVEQVAQFFADDRFIGIKHTSNDFFALEQFKTNFPDKLVYNGFDEMFLCGLTMGADGGIGSTYNFMAEKFIQIQKLFSENRTKEAQEIQKEANRIIKALCKVGVMEGEKEILCQLGFDFGHARAPFSQLNDEQKAFLKNAITDTL